MTTFFVVFIVACTIGLLGAICLITGIETEDKVTTLTGVTVILLGIILGMCCCGDTLLEDKVPRNCPPVTDVP